MDVSYIVFAGIIVVGISALPLVLRGVYKILKMFFQYKEKQEEKIAAEKISDAENKLKIVTDSGNISDLINAANELGDTKKK